MTRWRDSLRDGAIAPPEPHSEALEPTRCVRNLVALSALPAIWKDYEPARIAESAACALVSMLDADFVYIALPVECDEHKGDVVKTAVPVEAAQRLRLP